MKDNKLYAFINNTVQKKIPINSGYANGYVAVPPEHPYHGKHYDDVDVEIHGGLTFSENASEIKDWTEDTECLNFNNIQEIPNNYWVFGFDTFHYADDEKLDRTWCVAETERLMEQLSQKQENKTQVQ